MRRKHWKQTEAAVAACAAHERCDPGDPPTEDRVITFHYVVAGSRYTGEFASAEPWPAGTTFCVSYDPDDPTRTSFCDNRRDRNVMWLLVAIAALGIIVTAWLNFHHNR